MKALSTQDPIIIGDVEINPIDYAIRATANLGIKETGKSYSAGRGRPGFEGFPVVVVGDDEDADLPISKNTAADIMRAAMQEGVSVVFDVFSKNLTKSDFRGIVKEVTQVLLFENENYGLRHVFLEECGDLIPQKVYDKVTYAAVEQLIRVGGNSGVGVTILNPRILIDRKKVTLHQLRVLIGMSDSGTFGDYHRGLVKLGLARLENSVLYLEEIE